MSIMADDNEGGGDAIDGKHPERRVFASRTIAILFIFYALAYLDKKLITFLIEPIRESFGATDFQMSLVTGSAFVIFYVLFSIPIGWAVDRYSRRNIIFGGVVAWSVFATLGGLTKNYGQLLLTRCGVGAGEAVLGPAGNSLVADLIPRDKLTQATAITHAGVLAGSALAFVLGGVLLGFASREQSIALPLIGFIEVWQFVMIATGLPGLLISLLALLIHEPPRRGQMRRSGRGDELTKNAFHFMARNRRFYLAHFFGFSMISVGMAGFAGWMPTYMMRSYDVPVASLGAILGMFQFTFGAAGIFLPAFVIDRMFRAGKRDAHFHFFGCAALVMSAAGITLGCAPSALVAFGGIAVMDMMVGFLPAAGAAIQLTAPNEYRGQITAAFLISYNIIGQGLGPIVVAMITDFGFGDETRVGWSLAITLGVAGLIAALCLLMGRAAMRDAAQRHSTDMS